MTKNSEAKKVRTARITVRIPENLKRQYELYHLQQGRRGVSLNDIYILALERFISPDEADKREAAVARRLDQIEKDLISIERGIEIVAETTARFAKTYFMTTMEVPADQIQAAAAQGERRYQKFCELIAKRLQEGNTIFTELPETVFKPEDFAAEGTGKKAGAKP